MQPNGQYCFAVWISAAVCLSAAATEPGKSISFTKDVAPILVENCLGCHNAKDKKGKYDMSTYELLFKRGKDEEVLVPGKPDESLLLQLISGEQEPSMPKDAELLDKAVVGKVEQWIKEGATFDGSDKKVGLRELVRGIDKPIVTDYKTPTPTTALAFSPNAAALAVAAYHEITLWNPSSGQLVSRLPTKAERIYALEFSGDGSYLVHAGGTPGEMGEVVLWNAKTWKTPKELVRIEDVMFAATFSPDGKQIAACGADRLFRIWDVASSKQLHQVENHADWVVGITFSPDGKRVITVSRDKSAKIWDQSTKEPLLTFPGHTDGVYGIGLSPDGKTAVSAGADKMMRFWNTSGEAKEIRAVAAHAGCVYSLRFAKSGKTIYTAGADNLLKAWNPENGQHIRDFAGHKDWIYAIAVSNDEKWIATGSWDGEVRVWDSASGKQQQLFAVLPALAMAKSQAAGRAKP